MAKSNPTVTFNFDFFPWQEEAQLAVRNETVFVCARQIGKSLLLRRLLVEWALKRPNGQYWYVSPTLAATGGGSANVFRKMVQMLPPKLISVNKSNRAIEFPNGSKIDFVSYEQGGHLRGETNHGIIMDEVGEMTSSFWEEDVSPTLASTGGWVIHCGTPPDPMTAPDPSFFEGLFNDATTDPDIGLVHYDYTARAEYDPIYAAYVEKKKGMVKEKFDREYGAIFTRPGEGSLDTSFLRFYDDYDELPRPLATVITVDPSFSESDRSDPRAIVTTGVSPEGDMYVLDARQGRWGHMEFLNQLFNSWTVAETMGWEPQKMAIEKDGGGLPFINGFKRECQIRGMRRIPLIEIRGYKSKYNRGLSVEPWLTQGRLWMLRGHLGMDELIGQMGQFPRGLFTSSRIKAATGTYHHYDLLDALSYRTLDFTPPRRARGSSYEVNQLAVQQRTFGKDFEEAKRPSKRRRGMIRT